MIFRGNQKNLNKKFMGCDLEILENIKFYLIDHEKDQKVRGNTNFKQI